LKKTFQLQALGIRFDKPGGSLMRRLPLRDNSLRQPFLVAFPELRIEKITVSSKEELGVEFSGSIQYILGHVGSIARVERADA
jgi:hypothetical protein